MRPTPSDSLEVSLALASVDMMQSGNLTMFQIEQLMVRFRLATNAQLADALVMLMHHKSLYGSSALILEISERLKNEPQAARPKE